ncbi:hypothetical protein CLAIMM_14550 [Cladophialophora immunda]|nr:hypothetical protein CLAIMM_14550 [Cladophialophora immunda]
MGIMKEAELAVSPALLAVLPKDPRPWYMRRHLLLLNILLVGPMLSSCTFGYDGSMVNGLQSLPQWRTFFGNPSSSKLSAVNVVWPLGQLCGVYPTTWASDRFGRKVPIYIGFLILILASGLQGGARNLAMFIIARFLMGFGTSFTTQPAPILVTELAYPTHRGKVTAIYNTSNVGQISLAMILFRAYQEQWLGSIYAAWLIYGTQTIASSWSWRIPSILQGSLTVVQACLFVFLPESPRQVNPFDTTDCVDGRLTSSRWYISKDRTEEARRVLTKWHAAGDQSSPLVAFELAEIAANINAEATAHSKSSYLDLIRTAAMRKRTFIGMVVGFYGTWSGVAVISYYLTLVLDTVGITSAKSQTLVNGLLQVFNYLVAVTAAVLVDRVGRRRLFLTSACGMLLAFICMTVLSSVFSRSRDHQIGNSVVAFIFIYMMFYNVAFTPLLQAYPLELFPYLLRGRGLTVSLTTTFIGLVIGQSVNPTAMEHVGWKYYILFDLLLAILVALVYFLFPETRRKSLEEIAEVFGDQVIERGTDILKNDENIREHIEVSTIHSDAI